MPYVRTDRHRGAGRRSQVNRDEMDAAILEAVDETQIVNTRSLAFKRWRKIYVAGMRASLEHVHHNSDRAAILVNADELGKTP